MAALNDVPRLARNDEAGETRHGAGYRGTGDKKPSTHIVSDPFYSQIQRASGPS